MPTTIALYGDSYVVNLRNHCNSNLRVPATVYWFGKGGLRTGFKKRDGKIDTDAQAMYSRMIDLRPNVAFINVSGNDRTTDVKPRDIFNRVVRIVDDLQAAATAGKSQEAFVCNSLSDSIINFQGDGKFENRLKAIEEKIDQLQRLAAVDFENATALHKDTIPADCSEIYDRGIRSDGVYLISPDGRCPFRVYCDMTNGGWTLIQRRKDGSVNFYRPWDDYVIGFGDVDGEHWLGLDKIHRLTKAGTEIYFHMEKYDGAFEHAHYKVFTVHDATTAYRLNLDTFGYDGTVAEKLSHHDNMKFSTFDRDNDAHSTNCCERYGGGGFWYNSCYKYNPNGLYGVKSESGVAANGGHMHVKNLVIKVKRRHGLC